MVGYSWTTLFTKQTIQEGEDLADTGSVTNYYNGVGRQGGLCSGDVTEHGESYHVEVQVRRLWDRCYISSMRCTCSEGRLCRHCAALLSLVRLPDSRLYGFLVDNGRRFGMSDGEQASSEAQTKKKNAAEERKLPSLESLEALQSKTAEERKEQEEAESTYQPDPSYSYFRAEQYGKQVKMRPEVKNRAARFLQSGDIAEVRVRYAESDAEKEGGTVGHFSCVFPSTTDAAYLDVGQDEILNAGCDSWSCYGQNRRAADGSLLLCPHTAALLFYLQANLPGSGLGSSTNAAGRELLASANGGQTILEDAKDIARKTLTLEPVLSEVLEGVPNAEVVYQDAMKADLRALMGEGPYRVVANLPYYITSDVLVKLATAERGPESICIMVQKEAAERVMSAPGSKSWCAMAATVRFYGESQVLEEVPPEAFNPPPHVMSCFMRIDRHDQPPVVPKDRGLFLRLINAAFAMRRKTLANNLKASFGIGQEAAREVLLAAGVDERVRGEALDLEALCRVADALAERMG